MSNKAPLQQRLQDLNRQDGSINIQGYNALIGELDKQRPFRLAGGAVGGYGGYLAARKLTEDRPTRLLSALAGLYAGAAIGGQLRPADVMWAKNWNPSEDDVFSSPKTIAAAGQKANDIILRNTLTSTGAILGGAAIGGTGGYIASKALTKSRVMHLLSTILGAGIGGHIGQISTPRILSPELIEILKDHQ